MSKADFTEPGILLRGGFRNGRIRGVNRTSATERASAAVLLAQGIFEREDVEEAAESLGELERLAKTSGMKVLGIMTQRRSRPTPAWLLGAGKVEDLREACAQSGAAMVVFDNELSPAQAYNLSEKLGVKVMDRTELILRIFARRARSAEARIQVELAQLNYLLSRIPDSQRQSRFKGNIGMRGPGESPLSLRNVPMRKRLRVLNERLLKVRDGQARSRRRRRWPLVCLTGYTNVGKSTLLNVLAGGNAYVDDRLFATLDTRTRRLYLGNGREALMTDTVGFIRNLPHALVASFRSTMDVAAGADLLLVLADASHPFVLDQLEVTLRTLDEIGAAGVPRILVLNKSDRDAASGALLHATERHPSAIPVSARTGAGLDLLKKTLLEELEKCCTWWQPR